MFMAVMWNGLGHMGTQWALGGGLFLYCLLKSCHIAVRLRICRWGGNFGHWELQASILGCCWDESDL